MRVSAGLRLLAALSMVITVTTLSTSSADARVATATQAAWQLPASTRQLVVGVAANWDASSVTLQRYGRTGTTWKPVGPPFPGRLGAHGLVWGRGVNPRTRDMTDKREGDRRSPAGVFRLGDAFGYDPGWASRTKLPYITVGSRDLMVEDPESPLYNTYLRLDHEPSTPFEQAQRMVLGDPAHRLQVFIQHNTSPRPVAGKGSAILFHVWRNDGASATAGCTSMADADLETLVSWLDPAKRPLYVLLPAADYDALAKPWSLPLRPEVAGSI